MTSKRLQDGEVIRKIDDAIRDRILETDESDSRGNPVAAVPASDKHGLALKVGVALENIEERLDAICEEILEDDVHAAVPRYRLRGHPSADPNRPSR
jgi:hypothetical protein